MRGSTESRLPSSAACVQPKTRTPQVGSTLRSLSHNLALLPPVGEVVTNWFLPAPYDKANDELNLLLVLINNGGWWWWLVAAIGINTILSAFYYFRVIKAMYLADNDEPAFAPHPLDFGR